MLTAEARATVEEGKGLRRRFFVDTILGLDQMAEMAIVGRAMAARAGRNGHSVASVRELLEGLAFAELPPTAAGADLCDAVMERVATYIREG